MVDEKYWSTQKVIPVVVIKDADRAVGLARTLVTVGSPKIEITLRTPAALDAIKRIAQEVPEAEVGAGTVLNPALADAAIAAGAKFLVSPGSTSTLIDHLLSTGTPFLPGCATVSEAMRLIEYGIPVAKFFPAEESGGAPFLKGLSTVLQSIKFCPTGGINKSNYMNYLELPNVLCVGGSWIAPGPAIEAGAWDEIAELAAQV
jgi:2-dehydro-3-deoxyphosphogluconate aldolase / (4S)-4-hydroxy-2-oxoglutarate aldolase